MLCVDGVLVWLCAVVAAFRCCICLVCLCCVVVVSLAACLNVLCLFGKRGCVIVFSGGSGFPHCCLSCGCVFCVVVFCWCFVCLSMCDCLVR